MWWLLLFIFVHLIRRSGDCPSLQRALICHPLMLNELVQFKEETQNYVKYMSRGLLMSILQKEMKTQHD